LGVANIGGFYGLFACSILFNHESLHPRTVRNTKIVAAACRIASGSLEHLYLGDIAVVRDWGWAQNT